MYFVLSIRPKKKNRKLWKYWAKGKTFLMSDPKRHAPLSTHQETWFLQTRSLKKKLCQGRLDAFWVNSACSSATRQNWLRKIFWPMAKTKTLRSLCETKLLTLTSRTCSQCQRQRGIMPSLSRRWSSHQKAWKLSKIRFRSVMSFLSSKVPTHCQVR